MKFIDEIQIAGTALLLCGAMMVVSVVPKDKSIITAKTPFKEAPETAAEAQAQAEQEAAEAGFTIYTQENNYDEETSSEDYYDDSQSQQIIYDQDDSGDYEDNQDPSGDTDNGDVPVDVENGSEEIPQDQEQPQDVEGEISPEQPVDTVEEVIPEED